MRYFNLICSTIAIALLLPLAYVRAAERPAEGLERRGLRCITAADFPAAADAKVVPLPGADFETDGQAPPGWGIGGGAVAVAGDAPQGKAYCRIPLRQGHLLITPNVPGVPGSPHFLSFWLKSPADCWAAIEFGSDENPRTAGDHYPGTPATADQWRRVGYYFWFPVQCQTVRFHVQGQKPLPEAAFLAVDDFRLRTASEAEMSAAYEAERANLPPYGVTPRPDDGKHLALSVAKWKGQAGLPHRPFVIWALGSSFTNFQGDGYPLIRAIRERFPQAPPIVYKKHVSGGQPWDFVFGWVRQFVAAEQPDLIFTYANGSAEGLDRLLTEIRRRTTADVIVPSLHFTWAPKLTPELVEAYDGVTVEEVRRVCRKHGAEFVDNRHELAAYMQQAGFDPKDLLLDGCHQNQHGQIRIWDNICRHIAEPAAFDYAPQTRERRIAVSPAASTATEQVAFTGPWTAANGSLHTAQKDARLTVRFTGNRIDVIGRKNPGGGTLQVLIDGAPADRIPAFSMSMIRCDGRLWGTAPHAVDLLTHVVPQTWTITMTSDTGDYRLEGSVTGPDGDGHVDRSFTSRSGQIGIDPKLWRNRRFEKKGQPGVFEYTNKTGEQFSFDVYRCAVGTVGFRSEQPEPLCQPLAQNLTNGPHTLELIHAGDGEVNIEALYVFQPPSKDGPGD